ncbi:MAG TPA: hypothetical protein VGD65_11645 [Chryseosolibacter sp.]
MRRLAFALLFFLPDAFAQQVEGETELAGFVLGQARKNVHAQLGPPFQRSLHTDGWLSEFHKLKPDTSVYALFKYNPADTSRIYAIELVGEKFPEMHPFRGLKLGDTKEKVSATLGKSDRTETVDDPPVTTYFYNNENYSVDIDDRGLLYGIQIFGNILAHKPVGTPSVKHFKNAVVSKNIDSLVSWLAPDAELHKGGKVVTYRVGARAELADANSEFRKLLLGDTGSLYFVFAKEYAEGTSESRMHPELNQMTMVDKFFDSNTISEIVFRTHAGKWKVYEVIFR